MRDIKFRAWDVENNKMIQSYAHVSKYGQFYTAWTSTDSEREYIPMQYTGLKDKNGKEIFEGDIIEAYEFIQKPKMVVKFDEEMAGFIPFIWKQSLEYQDYIGYFAYEDWCIVIGNIYENPELLDN